MLHLLPGGADIPVCPTINLMVDGDPVILRGKRGIRN